MEYCGPRGIPHSEFLSWSEDDQDKALQWMIDGRSKCPQCGTYPSEWLDDEGRWVSPAPYVAEVELCGGCEALHEAQEEIPEEQRYRYHAHLARREKVPRPKG